MKIINKTGDTIVTHRSFKVLGKTYLRKRGEKLYDFLIRAGTELNEDRARARAKTLKQLEAEDMHCQTCTCPDEIEIEAGSEYYKGPQGGKGEFRPHTAHRRHTAKTLARAKAQNKTMFGLPVTNYASEEHARKMGIPERTIRNLLGSKYKGPTK